MTTLHVTDQNTGQIVAVDIDSPAGNLYIRDYEGNLVQLDLSSPAGTIKVLDADTGQTLTIDYSNPTTVFTVIDPNTGEFVDVDLSNLSGILYSLDEDTGEFVSVNLSTAKFAATKSLGAFALGQNDTTGPTCAITCAQTGPTATSPLNYTITFSEAVTGFAVGDFTIGGSGGTKANFATADNITFTCNVTPTATGTLTADVAGGVCTDAAGNANTAATQHSIAIVANVLAFNGTSARVSCGAGNGLDDLHDNEFTAEAWFKCTNGASGGLTILSKGVYSVTGWWILLIGNLLDIGIKCATTNSVISGTVNLNDGNWHHICIYWNDAGDRKVYAAIDGTWRSAGNLASGAIVSDSARNFLIGANDSAGPQYLWNGNIGWGRISNNDRYSHSTNFTPPKLNAYPASDANTIALWKTNEGTGITLDNAEGTATRDGTITNATWTTDTNP